MPTYFTRMSSRDLILPSRPVPRPSLPPARWTAWLGAAAVLLAALWPVEPCAAKRPVSVITYGPGVTPFINLVRIQRNSSVAIKHVTFTVAPKPGSVTRPISAHYSFAYLQRRGFVDAQTGAFTVPVFGLYAGYVNKVELIFRFADGTSQINHLSLPAPKFAGGAYDHPFVVQARAPDAKLSYDFIMLKSFSNLDSPTIIDSDGEIRWVGTAKTSSAQAIYFDNSFFVVAPDGTTLVRMEYDGAYADVVNYASQGVTLFAHNFDFGKEGILSDVNTPEYTESTVMEVNAAGAVLHTWDFAQIISSAIIAGGEDPTDFVPAPYSQVDWFHCNSATYRPSDNTLVVSSRENFVMGVDYETQAIKWILGDPTKQWYEYASLRKYALQGESGTHYPIGQHAVSFFNDKLVLFDDGVPSASHVPAGKSRTYSAPRKYVIDDAAGTAQETWNYLADPPIFSPVGGSVYEDLGGNYLVDYATGGPELYAEIVGLAPGNQKAFDYRFTTPNVLTTAWNSVVLHMEDMAFN
jgi:arylsulfate sulfotransferase